MKNVITLLKISQIAIHFFLMSYWFMEQLQKCKNCQKLIKHPLKSMSQVKAYKQKSEVPGFEHLQFFCMLRCPLFLWQNLQQYLQATHRNKKIGGTRSCRARNRQNMRLVLKMGQNDFNSVLRPPIKILSTLFTLQLLILPTRDPFHGQLKEKIKFFSILHFLENSP